MTYDPYDPTTIDRATLAQILGEEIDKDAQPNPDRAELARFFFDQLIDHIMRGEFFRYGSENHWTVQEEIHDSFLDRLTNADFNWGAEILVPTTYPGVEHLVVERGLFLDAIAAFQWARQKVATAHQADPSLQAWFRLSHKDLNYEITEMVLCSDCI